LETDLYLPVKRYLEALGLEVKGEVRGCDLVGIADGTPELVVIGELKQTFTLELVLQAVDRTPACDEIWLAVAASRRGRGREGDPRVKKLCRFLGFGLLAVTPPGQIEVIVEPEPWKPRRDGKRRSRIVAEFRRRRGDPVSGGSTRLPQMTAYRQQALTVASALAAKPSAPRHLKAIAPDAAKILQTNVYGWFERIERGLYGLTGTGHGALVTFADHLPAATPDEWPSRARLRTTNPREDRPAARSAAGRPAASDNRAAPWRAPISAPDPRGSQACRSSACRHRAASAGGNRDRRGWRR